MAQQTINIGVNPNDGTGDPVRTAFSKTNANTTELYAAVGAAEKSVNKGVANGYAGLDGSGKVPSSVVPVATQSALGGVKPDGVTMTASQDGTLAVTGQSVDQLQDASAFTATQINSGYLSIRVAGVDYKITPAALVSAQIKTIDGLPTVSSLSLSDETAVYDVSGSATGKTTFSAIQALMGTGGGGNAPVNTAIPVISGTAQVGQTLTASNGTWSNSPTSYAYAWKRAGTAISGATSSTYVPVSADVGNALTVTVTATNASGSASATSTATSAVIAAGGGGSYPALTFAGTPTFDTSTPLMGAASLASGSGTAPINLGAGNSHFCLEMLLRGTNGGSASGQFISLSDGTNTIGAAWKDGNRPAASKAVGDNAGSTCAIAFDGAKHFCIVDYDGTTLNVMTEGGSYQSYYAATFAGGASCTLNLALPTGLEIDAIRVSNISRYPSGSTAPAIPTSAPTRDANVVVIYNFENQDGTGS